MSNRSPGAEWVGLIYKGIIECRIKGRDPEVIVLHPEMMRDIRMEYCLVASVDYLTNHIWGIPSREDEKHSKNIVSIMVKPQWMTIRKCPLLMLEAINLSDTLKLQFLQIRERELARELDTIITQIKNIEDKGIVRVQFPGTYKDYAYRDPNGALLVGDLVKVPTYHGTGPEQIATVVGFGKGTFRGEIVSRVISKLVEERI